jgi:hypothetical protein
MSLSEDTIKLSPDTIRRLKGLIRDTTALVFVDARPVGTAFFISDDLLLTCEHVTTESVVTIQLVGRQSRLEAKVIATDTLDLALLRSQRVDDEPPTCVVLDRALHQDDGDCFVAGFPREDGQPPGLEIFDVQAHPRTDLDGADLLLQIEAGKIVTWGMSGGPVVSTRSGAVIGIIRTSKDPTDALGGGAIPVSRAAAAFGQVAQIVTETIPAMVPWRNALGRDHWQQLGKQSWDTEEHIDLWVSGGRKSWQISLAEAAGSGPARTGLDLGEEVAVAIFHWAQRRQTRGADEVELLGRLLASALFPQPAEQHLGVARHTDRIVVRLHVEQHNDLADIPWELAAIPGGKSAVPGHKGRFLAADPQFRFVRVDDAAGPRGPAAPKPAASVTVLAAVAQPARWRFPEVHGTYKSDSYPWPNAAKMVTRLRDVIERNGFTAEVPRSLRYSDLRTALTASAEAGRPYDVLHYMGTGQCGMDGKAVIAFVDDDDGESWEDVSNVLETASRTGVRLVIFELMLPPTGRPFQPLTLRTLGNVVGGSVSAAVLTNLPVHPLQCHTFNDKFYDELKSGESVAAAVQGARNKVMYDKPVEDAAGFGWFTIVTGPQSDFSLVSLQPKDPTMSGARQQTTTHRPAGDHR